MIFSSSLVPLFLCLLIILSPPPSDGAIEALVIKKCQTEGPSFVHGNGVNHLHTPYFHTLIDQFDRDDKSGGGSSNGGGSGSGGSGNNGGGDDRSNGVNHLHTPYFHTLIDQFDRDDKSGGGGGGGDRDSGGYDRSSGVDSPPSSSSSGTCCSTSNTDATISHNDEMSCSEGLSSSDKASRCERVPTTNISPPPHDWVFYGRDWQNPLKVMINTPSQY